MFHVGSPRPVLEGSTPHECSVCGVQAWFFDRLQGRPLCVECALKKKESDD